ncbi:hypothetical protein NSPZN2_10426 [Nitrospira defluvii]|uniref:Uncharacterized protein n=1 Tax=Nitrospira defluvii TaxID=330214 RepID=A0ABM8QG37_9BACT|nr:hypothetical protein NSPZN2_10426 [Nitrospira defluvii]
MAPVCHLLARRAFRERPGRPGLLRRQLHGIRAIKGCRAARRVLTAHRRVRTHHRRPRDPYRIRAAELVVGSVALEGLLPASDAAASKRVVLQRVLRRTSLLPPRGKPVRVGRSEIHGRFVQVEGLCSADGSVLCWELLSCAHPGSPGLKPMRPWRWGRISPPSTPPTSASWT